MCDDYHNPLFWLAILMTIATLVFIHLFYQMSGVAKRCSEGWRKAIEQCQSLSEENYDQGVEIINLKMKLLKLEKPE